MESFRSRVLSNLAAVAAATFAACGSDDSVSTGGATGSVTSTGAGGTTLSDAAQAGGNGGTGGSSGGGAGTAGAGNSPDASPGDGGLPSRFPDTTSTIAILADQFPPMTSQQLLFAVSHYVGTEKQVLDVTQKLRAANPDFVVLHYHLSMWQSAPTTSFIVDGKNWSNDYPTVTQHEPWFWHNSSNARVASQSDGKLLMNVSNAEFQAYWADSLIQQVKLGEYDAVFFDSASPALLQGEASANDPRLAGTAVKDATFAELGGTTFIRAWESWIRQLDAALRAQGIPLLPNTGAFITSWDNTNYGLSAGAFVEGFADPSFAPSDWRASTNELLALVRAGKFMILQNYLSSPSEVSKRLYYLGNYLLVKGNHTYLDYFAAGPLEWYPEWQLALGNPVTTATVNVDDLLQSGVYRREFQNGIVLVNPSQSSVDVALGVTFKRVVPQGGGSVPPDVAPNGQVGTLSTTDVSTIVVAPTSAEILLK